MPTTRRPSPPPPRPPSPQGTSTDKLTANVSFPLKDLRLHQFASPESPAGPAECCYELYAVSNHYGNLSGECRPVSQAPLRLDRLYAQTSKRRQRMAAKARAALPPAPRSAKAGAPARRASCCAFGLLRRPHRPQLTAV